MFAASFFIIQMYVHDPYDMIYMNMVAMIVVSADFHQITFIKDTDNTVLLMIVCPFVLIRRPGGLDKVFTF